MKTILRAAVSFVLATSAFIGSATAQTPPADLIVVNAKIWTGDEDQPGAEALAITDGRFVAVGDEMSVRAHIGDATRIIDAGGSRIIPGLIDTHVHLVNAAESLARLDLRMARSRTALLQMVSDYAATLDQDAWLIGRGWSAESWPDPKPPTADEIDDAAGGRPAVLIRMDGHSLLAGRSALEYANIDEQGPPDPTGGRIGRGAARNPPGGGLGEAHGLIY
ncbi:MAG: amidohydrolase family protein, partial [Planctomycetota bacterium]|nr:amidohydrolase family protein [Planctomycetota bacterium]